MGLKQEVKLAVQEAVAETLKQINTSPKHECIFDISPEEAKKTSTYLTMFTTLGDGDLTQSVQLIVDNHKYLKGVRERNKSIMKAATVGAVTICISGVGFLLWEGIKIALAKS